MPCDRTYGGIRRYTLRNKKTRDTDDLCCRTTTLARTRLFDVTTAAQVSSAELSIPNTEKGRADILENPREAPIRHAAHRAFCIGGRKVYPLRQQQTRACRGPHLPSPNKPSENVRHLIIGNSGAGKVALTLHYSFLHELALSRSRVHQQHIWGSHFCLWTPFFGVLDGLWHLIMRCKDEYLDLLRGALLF